MPRAPFHKSSRLTAWAVIVAAALPPSAHALERDRHGGGERRPVYQRHAFRHDRHARYGNEHAHHANWPTPQVNAGWFQRPYPYHLDYYKMRYGGSYAPYFGNLYGPPQVVTAPPYYGTYYGGGYDVPAAGPYMNGYPAGFNGPAYDAPVAPSAPNADSSLPSP